MVAQSIKVVVGVDSKVAKCDWLVGGVIVREQYGVSASAQGSSGQSIVCVADWAKREFR
ncbi:hypothetical protein NC653_011675 [Populus alba x Populus x berolinensis]|uniref:Uncharacterized protein n=1 Tax=Populus alba x Populus x berolinensis TaxID=444605 RepID=A0AAD6R457_9ROSI|nr:hypothetical protein NC653_011675 [Populus alba x Populus x berolinensis]